MKTEKEWKKAFQISDEDYYHWEQASQNSSVIKWALKHKKIDLYRYMKWAVSHYSIPWLKDSFLEQSPLAEDLWTKVKDKAQWSEDFTPLYLWKEKIFAGCVEPPVNNNPLVVPLLASPKILDFCWSKLQQPTTADERPESAHTVNKNSENPSIIESISGIFKKTSKKSKDSSYEQIFSGMNKYCSAVIVFHIKNQEFLPIQSTIDIKQKDMSISIKEPSLFRMLVRSETPFHGVVGSNAQHLKYFQQLGFPKLPECVTLIPVHNKSQKLCGAVLGVLKPPFFQRRYLNNIMQTAKPLKDIFSNQKEKLKPSA